jgi:hypothetical protein
MSDEATTRPPATPWSVGPAWPAVPAEQSLQPLPEPVTDAAALQLLLVAIVGGLVAQGLFFGEVLGINLVIWAGFVLFAAFATRKRDVAMDRADLWLPPGCLAFAGFVAVRGDGALVLFETIVALTLLVASAIAMRGVAVTRATWRTAVAINAMVAAVVLVGAARLGGGFRPLRGLIKRESTAMQVAVGILLALPLVLVFGYLFSAADAVFATQLDRLVALDISVEDRKSVV